MNKQQLVTAARIIIALIAWFGLGLQQYILIDNIPGNGLTTLQAIARFFGFFTILTNLLVATSLTIIIVSPGSSAGRFFQKSSVSTAIALYILIVGIVYNVILRQLWNPQGMQKIADEILHVIVPLLYVLYWFFFIPKGTLRWKDSVSWLIYPAIYLVYALTRGITEGFYAYPFIDLKVNSAAKVALNCAGLFVVFLITGLLFIAIDRAVVRSEK